MNKALEDFPNNGSLILPDQERLIVCMVKAIKRKLLFSYKRLSKEDAEFLKGGAHFAENSNEN